MGKFGRDVDILKMHARGVPDEIKGRLDIDFLIDIPNRSSALTALEWMTDQGNEVTLAQRHTSDEVARAWRGVLRGCITHDVVIPHYLRGFAKRLGIMVPS